MTPRHKAALAFARAGIPIFPCKVNGKEPAVPEGFKDATTDEATINAWFERADYNIACEPERAGWCVVDLDGEIGLSTWRELCEVNGSVHTRAARTPGGGLHLYFKGSLPGTVGTERRGIGKNIDTRGVGSYVLLPPSYVVEERKGYEGPYTWEPGPEPQPLPEWVAAKVQRREHAPRAAVEGTKFDSEAAIVEAVSEIRRAIRLGGEPVEGEASDNRTYELACRLKDLGLTEETCDDLLHEHWAPHFDKFWIETKTRSAWRSGQNQPGSDAPIPPQWRNIELPAGWKPPPEPKPRPLFKRVYDIRHETFPEPKWVWKDRLLMGEPNLYTGDGGVGKTTLAENLAVAVAAGVELLGAPTTKMPVALLVGEDTYGPVRNNLMAICAGLGVGEEVLQNVYLLSVKSDRVEGGHRIVAVEDDTGKFAMQPFMELDVLPWLNKQPPLLFVIDPLMEFARFSRHNDEACRGLVTGFLAGITQAGHTVLVNDHPSKTAMASGDHYAGSTQLKAAFPLFATLTAKGKFVGGERDLLFSVIKGRYAAEQDVKLVRTSKGPTLELSEGRDRVHDETDIELYAQMHTRILAGERWGQDNRASAGSKLSELSFVIGLEEGELDRRLTKMKQLGWLDYDKGAYALGTKAPEPFALKGEKF